MIFDEASQIWELITIFLLLRLSGYNKRIILGGVHIQLDPYVTRDIEDAPSIMTWVLSLNGTYKVPKTLLRRQ